VATDSRGLRRLVKSPASAVIRKTPAARSDERSTTHDSTITCGNCLTYVGQYSERLRSSFRRPANTHSGRRAFCGVLVELRFPSRNRPRTSWIAKRLHAKRHQHAETGKNQPFPSALSLFRVGSRPGLPAAELVRRVEEILPRDLKRRKPAGRAQTAKHPNKSD